MEERYSISDAIERFRVPLLNEMLHFYNLGLEDGKSNVLDKIRAEIEELDGKYVIGDYATYGEYSPKYVQLMEVLQIIDKYREGAK